MLTQMKIFKKIPRLTLPIVQSNNWVSLCLVVGILFMREIQLTKGYVALVDDEDYDSLIKFKWSAKVNKHTVYAYRSEKGKCIWMHRSILNIDNCNDLRGDHLDHNGLNNQRSNLRIATHSENNCYKKKRKKLNIKLLRG